MVCISLRYLVTVSGTCSVRYLVTAVVQPDKMPINWNPIKTIAVGCPHCRKRFWINGFELTGHVLLFFGDETFLAAFLTIFGQIKFIFASLSLTEIKKSFFQKLDFKLILFKLQQTDLDYFKNSNKVTRFVKRQIEPDRQNSIRPQAGSQPATAIMECTAGG